MIEELIPELVQQAEYDIAKQLHEVVRDHCKKQLLCNGCIFSTCDYDCSVYDLIEKGVNEMTDTERLQRIKNAIATVSDYCNGIDVNCERCPFEKVLDDGSGICKFRTGTGFPGWQLKDLFAKDNDGDENYGESID